MFEKNSLWVFAGDSITEGGRRLDAKIWDGDRLGSGYVYLLNAALTAFFPELETHVENRGIGGDTSFQLRNRWHSDVLSLKPDYLFLMIGVNDVWRHFDGFYFPQDFIDSAQYKDNCRFMIDSALSMENLKQMWILSPFMFERNTEDAMCAMVRQYAKAMHDVAKEFNLPFIDIQAAIDKVLQCRHSCIFSSDRVHPNAAGNMLIAGEIWKVLVQS